MTFHFNGKTGTTGECAAQPGNCPLGGDSGTDNHFESHEDAQAALRVKMVSSHGEFSTVRRVSETLSESTASEKLTKDEKVLRDNVTADIAKAVNLGELSGDLDYLVTVDDLNINTVITHYGEDSEKYDYVPAHDSGRRYRIALKPELRTALDEVYKIVNPHATGENSQDKNKRVFRNNVTLHNDVDAAYKVYMDFSSEIREIVKKGKAQGLTDKQIIADDDYREASERFESALVSYQAASHASILHYDAGVRGEKVGDEWVNSESAKYGASRAKEIVKFRAADIREFGLDTLINKEYI